MESGFKGYSSMEMDEECRRSWKDRVPSRRSLILLVSGALLTCILFVMVMFILFGYQERKFAELEGLMRSHNSSLNSMNSELTGKLKDSGTELKTMVSELKQSVSGLSSSINIYTSRTHDQLSTGPPVKMLSDLQVLINNLGSSLSSLASKLETKLQDTVTQQNGQHTELRTFLDRFNSSVSAATAELQSTVMQQDVRMSRIQDLLASLNSSLASFESKQQRQTQDSDQRLMTALSDMKAKLDSDSKVAESQNRMLIEVVKLSSSVESLSSKIERTDQRLMTALSEIKAKLESSTKAPEVTSCKPGWTQHLSRCYLFSINILNWHQAREYCRTQNASLLKLESEEEWVFVTARQKDYWIGLTDELTGQWRWVDETPYVMNEKWWEPGQPDDWKAVDEDGENCAHIKPQGLLNDLHCSARFNFICKV